MRIETDSHPSSFKEILSRTNSSVTNDNGTYHGIVQFLYKRQSIKKVNGLYRIKSTKKRQTNENILQIIPKSNFYVYEIKMQRADKNTIFK